MPRISAVDIAVSIGCTRDAVTADLRIVDHAKARKVTIKVYRRIISIYIFACPSRTREEQEKVTFEYKLGEGKSGDDANPTEGQAPQQQRRYRLRRHYDGYYRGGRRSGPAPAQQGENAGEGGEQVEGNGEGNAPPRGGGRGRGAPSRRYFRRNFRGGRGGGPPRRPRSQDGQVRVSISNFHSHSSFPGHYNN